MEIIGVVMPGSSDPKLARSVGEQMSTSFTEAVRAVRVLEPDWPQGTIEVSFSDKYTPTDGGSVAAAFALLMLSLVQEFELDPGFAITGDITVDGKVRPIGGVGGKIRGATQAGSKVVAVPKANTDGVTDAVLLDGLETVLLAQVVAVDTLEDARALAMAEKTGNAADAIVEFAKLQTRLRPGQKWQPNGPDVQTLERVLELCPQHLSADLALKTAQNKLLCTLTVNASIDEAFLAARPIWPDVLEDKLRAKTLDRRVMQEIRQRLRLIQLRAHPQAKKFVVAMNAYAVDVEHTVSRGASSTRIREINESIRGIAKEAQALSTNRELLEQLAK